MLDRLPIALALTVALVAPGAWAQLEAGAPALAEQRYQSARARYLDGDFEGAADDFRTAYDLFPESAKLAFNLARVHERLGRLDHAVAYYERYLELAEAAADRGEIQALIESLRRRLAAQQGQLVVTTDPAGAAVFVDAAGTPAGRTPVTLRLEPGSHAVRITHPGHRASLHRVSLGEGGREALTVTLERARPGEVASGTGAAPWAPLALVGVGAALAGAGAYFVAEGLDAEASRDATIQSGGSVDDARAADADARTFETWGWVGVGVGVSALAGGVLWWSLSDDAPVAVVPWGVHGAAAQVRF